MRPNTSSQRDPLQDATRWGRGSGAREAIRFRRLRWLVLFAAGWLLFPPCGQAQLAIDWFTIDGGGLSYGFSGNLRLGGSCGQPDAGTLAGGDYVLRGGFWSGGGVVSSVEVDPLEEPELPTTFRILAGLNNPFRHETGIRLELPEPRLVEARVFDYAGRLVTQLYHGPLPAGRHLLTWRGVNRFGQPVMSGAYLLDVRAGDDVTRKRVVLLR